MNCNVCLARKERWHVIKIRALLITYHSVSAMTSLRSIIILPFYDKSTWKFISASWPDNILKSFLIRFSHSCYMPYPLCSSRFNHPIGEHFREIKFRRLRWGDHVARMEEDRSPFNILTGKPTGKRPLGRCRRRWGGQYYLIKNL